jgi:ABC-type antimicrobial peptide transport system permease subunit
MYFPLAQARFPQPVLYLAVRSAVDTRVIARGIKRAVSDADRTVPVSDLKTMNERLAESIDVTRFSTFLASLFAAVAVALGGVGIYSTVAYIVVQRRREIGVRIALGATPTHVMGHMLGRIVVLAGLSIVLGALAAWMLSRTLASLLVGVNPHDPAVFLSAAAAFGLVAFAAASIPALRTTRVNPVTALSST